jgi:hypothetical protein
MQNQGIEISVNFNPVRTKDWNWEVYFSFSKNNNKIIKVDDRVDENGRPLDDINNNWFVGYPVNVYYDYVFDGIWQLDDDIANSHMPESKPGSIKLKDLNGDGRRTIDDRQIFTRDPDWYSSFGTKLSWKGIDLSVDCYLLQGGYVYNPYLTSFNQGGDLTGKRGGINRNYWTTNNPSNEAVAPNMNQPAAYISSLGYENASYFRLRNITLGYSFPKNLISKIKMQNLRIYFTLTNYLTITEVRAYGPEQSTGAYPEPKTVMLGLKCTY